MLEKGFIEDDSPKVEKFEFYLEAFRELSSCRQIGMGAGPIPFTAVYEYSKIFRVEDFEEFLYLIRRMDDTYLELENKKSQGVANGSDNGNKKNHS